MNLESFKEQVQHNCDVSDAGYGGVFSLCGFLLRLRDLYKWKHDIPPWEEPEPADLMEWVSLREELWESLVDAELRDLTLNGRTYHPFDAKGVNEELRPLGLIYGGGYVYGMKPSFFLGELAESRSMGELRIDLVERELIRDLYTTPAMRQGRQIFARRSAMVGFLWDRVLEMRPSARDALVFALEEYGVDADALRASPKTLGKELTRVAASELETWIHHEVGEVLEDAFPGRVWHEIVSTYSNSPIEVFARVVKDLAADTHPRGLLGYIVENRRRASLGFYWVFTSAFTRHFLPELKEGFREFLRTGEWGPVEGVRLAGREKARRSARLLVEIHEEGRERGAEWARDRIFATLLEPLGIERGSRER